MFSFVKKEKESSRESCERAKRQLRGGLERAERESWDTERGTKERALRERELKRVQKRAQGRGSHIHSLLSSYVLCPPKGEAAVRLLWFSFKIKSGLWIRLNKHKPYSQPTNYFALIAQPFRVYIKVSQNVANFAIKYQQIFLEEIARSDINCSKAFALSWRGEMFSKIF